MGNVAGRSLGCAAGEPLSLDAGACKFASLMTPNSLIDLYFPMHAAEPERLVEAARGAGIDAVVVVADTPDELPDDDEVTRLNAAGGPQIHRAVAVGGEGFRVALLLAGGFDAAPFDAIEAAGDPTLIQAAVHELRGCAIPICPRQTVEGGVVRRTAALPAEPAVGVVAMVAGGNHMGRDLDVEDAAIAGRRVLSATGPFGKLADFGRYATLLPAAADDPAAIIRSLNQGYGVGIELVTPPPDDEAPNPRGHGGKGRGSRGEAPNKGGEGEGAKPHKRRRRRRRRGKGGDKGSAPAP